MIKITTNSAVVFTDGACIKNPGPGGNAALIISNGAERIVTGSDTVTTNNRMELTAAIKALEAVPDTATIVLIHSDSRYVIDGVTKWLPGWKAKRWRKADGKPVLNQNLWMHLDELVSGRSITWQWVKGHAGHEQNERVDALASTEAEVAAWRSGLRDDQANG
jgi:ribonuclease HI